MPRLSAHPAVAPLVAATGGIRVPGAADPHEMLIRAMIGQQITVAAATLSALTALTAGLGSALAPQDGLDRLFPR
jgi:AraC family transcriptional regulator of adaptative response / DNA-3-methyladenine glycosylase II